MTITVTNLTTYLLSLSVTVTVAVTVTEGVVAMRQAEQQAKQAQRGLWATFVPPAPSPHCRSFEAVVIEVVSGELSAVSCEL